MDKPNVTNRYLEDDFAPVSVERTVSPLDVRGRIPEYLEGLYLRNGPNPLEAPDPSTYHWFMGTGMVHGVRLGDGRAQWYRNRWVRNATVARALGEAVRPGPVHVSMDMSPNTNVIRHGGRILTLIEGGPLPYEMTDLLDTVGPYDFDGTLGGGFSAHPLTDPLTGELHAVSYFWAWGTRVRYTVIGPDGRLRRSVDVEVGGLPMMHSFSLTERYVVLYDLPVSFDLARTSTAASRLPARVERAAERMIGRGAVPERAVPPLSRRTGRSSDFPYSWDPARAARVGLLPREGEASDVRWYDVEPCYVYHPVNAYEEDGRVIADVVRHRRTFVADRHGPFEHAATLERWTVDPSAAAVKEERLDQRGQEFPRIDERRVGRAHRYSYSAGTDDDGVPSSTVLRHDHHNGTVQTRDFGPGAQTGEFVFVPSGPASAEDDGVVLGYVYDLATHRSALHILEAATLEPVATVDLPTRVPHGFHGNWLAT